MTQEIQNSGLCWKGITYDIPLAKKTKSSSSPLSFNKDSEKGSVDHNGSPEEPKSRTILNNLSGSVARGEFVAVLGASGSGKTTLLNVLSGRLSGKGHIDGTVLYQGAERRASTWKRTVAFVEQDDALLANLTVRETIAYSAKLRLPSKQFDKQAKQTRIEETLEMLRLEECADGRIGSGVTRGISGGERKRTSIGVVSGISRSPLYTA